MKYFRPEGELFKKLVFNTPWARICPFIIGLILGYIIFVEKSNETMTKLSSVYVGIKILHKFFYIFLLIESEFIWLDHITYLMFSNSFRTISGLSRQTIIKSCTHCLPISFASYMGFRIRFHDLFMCNWKC